MTTTSWEELNGFPLTMRVPVLWGDMDPLGHVNNTRFFRWFESARVAYLDRSIIENDCLPARGGAYFGLHSLQLPPSGDLSRYDRSWGADFAFGQFKHDDAASFGESYARELAAEGESIVVTFDYRAQRPVWISSDVRESD